MSAPGVMSAQAAADPAVPTFVNGMAQNVFTADRAEWVTGEVWVESNFDSDRDGKRTASTPTTRCRPRRATTG